MTFPQFLSTVSQALRLLATYPFRSLAVALVFLVVVEAFMFIPYVGFVLKVALAAVIGAQALAIFAAAAAGRGPSPAGFLSAFSLPATAQAALVFGGLVPFAAGMLFLYVKAGPTALEFFFGNIFEAKPPAQNLFIQMKYIMLLFGLPFTFLAGAVVLKGLSGFAAISAALTAAVSNWLPILLLALITLAYEGMSVQLPAFMPKLAATVVSGLLLLLFVAWSFAIVYTVSARVFAHNAPANAA